MSDNRPIGIFDSGLGGLTVMKEIVRLLPNENIVYFGDTGRVPYGNRSKSTINRYAAEDEQFLLRHNVKAIVAACGTVSAVAAKTGENLPVPFFEVISPATRAAVKATKNGRIGVIGTSATVNSGEHKRQINAISPDLEVLAISCPLFVPLVEEGLTNLDDTVVYETAMRYLKPLKDFGVDTLVLGCTHYPLLQNVISDIMGKGVTLINMGVSTAIAIKEYLTENAALNTDTKAPTHQFFVSDMTQSFENTAYILLGEKIDGNNAKQVNINEL